MINPQFLKTFVILAESRSFTRAAQILNMTQPGVSQHLARLEEYFGVPLVIRKRNLFELNEAGKKVLKHATDLFKLHDDFVASIKMDDPRSGICKFASPGSFGMKLYTALLKLNEIDRGLVIHYSYAPNPMVLQLLRDHQIDVGFVTIEPSDPEFSWKIVDHERLVLAVPKKFRFTGFDSLKSLGFMNHPDGFHHAGRLLRENFPHEFRSMAEIPIRAFNNQITRIPEAVSAGLGFTALPEYACLNYSDPSSIKILPLKRKVVDPIYKVWRRDVELPARFAFIERKVGHIFRPKGFGHGSG